MTKSPCLIHILTFPSLSVNAHSNMCAGLVSCHALLLNINYPQLRRCVGGEDAGQKERGRKINEHMPPFTPSSSPRVFLSEETSDEKEMDEKWKDGGILTKVKSVLADGWKEYMSKGNEER